MIKNMINNRLYLVLVLAAVAVGSGCTALQPFPNIARGGDTIALAVGSPEDMTRANTTATFTSDIDGIPIDITPNIRSIFKLYADPDSKVYDTGSNTASLVSSAGHSPWITIAVVDLPAGLTVGNGQIAFNTTATYPAIGSHINNLQLPVEIIAGIGSANTFNYEVGIGAQLTGDLTALEALPRAEYGPANPSVACPCPNYAAIEVKTNIPTSLGSLPSGFVRVVPSDLTVDTASGRSIVHGASGEDLTVIFFSNGGALKYYEAQFSVVLHSSPAVSFIGTPTITSVRYFDINGNEVVGPVADYAVALK